MNKTKKSEDLTKEKKSDVLQFHSKKSADLAPSKNEGGNKINASKKSLAKKA